MKVKKLIIIVLLVFCNLIVTVDRIGAQSMDKANSNQMENIILVATISSAKGSEDKMHHLLQQLVVESRKESGCIRYDLHLSIEKPNVFVMYEIWQDQSALDDHMQSVHFTSYKKNSQTILESLEVVKLKKLDN
jgi:quinol monooxygenase YgiN